MGNTRFEAEFGQYAGWVVDAIHDIGFPDPIPAACRGTGNPSLLERLAADLMIEEDDLVLDVGVGLGGPGAWLVRRYGCTLVGVDIMMQAVTGARRLFADVRVAAASSRALPFRDRTFDAVWSLGVVEMISDKRRAFEEIVRVTVPGGRVVLYDFVAMSSPIEDPPAADRFEAAGEIVEKLKGAGLLLLRSEEVPYVPPPPAVWRDATTHVRRRIREAHDGDRRLVVAEKERDSFNRLRRSGCIREWEFVAETPK